MSTFRRSDDPAAAAGGDPVAAGWAWLATLPRAVTAHADRGDDPLAAVRGLLAELGDPHLDLRVVHIAGSKGKGSTALFCEALLERLGLRTFTFTSPHLERWTERFRLGGAEAAPRATYDALCAVRDASMGSGIVPGFFEALTVAGLVLARRDGVDCAVFEAGVGGRADATNVVHPAVTVITSIELEHTERLGDTAAAIAREKAGIVKPGAPLVAPCFGKEVATELEAAVAAAGVEWMEVRPVARAPRQSPGTHSVVWAQEEHGLAAAGPGWHVRTALASPGTHMAANAALALAAVGRLGIASAEALQGAARVLAETAPAGRMETVSALPWVIIDAAHTRASAEALAGAVQRLAPRRVHLLLSVSRSKDIDAVLDALLPLADAITTTCADSDYSLDADSLALAAREQGPPVAVHACAEPIAALAAACSDRPGETLVLATGSVYLAGLVRRAFAESGARQGSSD